MNVLAFPAQQKSGRSRVPTETLVALYEQHGTLDRVAEIVGLNRASIHERLQKAGYEPRQGRHITDAERETVRLYYVNTPEGQFCLDEIAKRVRRTKQLVSRIAGELGLTNYKRPSSAETIKRMKDARAGQWSRKPHPRGMLGKTHGTEQRAAVSRASKLRWVTDKTFGIGFMSEEMRQARSDRATLAASKRPAENNYSRVKQGRRQDLDNQFFRSAWEANYARYLNMLIRMKVVERWEYEPETFWFEAIRRGVRSYRPDFKIYYRNDPRPEYIEIKGWFDDKSKTKMKRMKKYYPEIKLVLIGAKEYRALKAKWASAINGWES